MSKSRKTTAKLSLVAAAKAATRMRKAKAAPGNAKALQQKAADNVKTLRSRAGKAEVIAIINTTADGAYVYVEGSKGSHFTRLRSGDNKEFRTYATKGALYEPAAKYNRLNPAPKPLAKLARGVEGKMTENSRKAVADQKAAPAPKGKAAAKAPKAAKAKAGSDYTYKPTKKANTAKADSLRGRMLSVIMAHTDTASAKAAATKAKLTGLNSGWFNWAAANGYITK